MFPIGLLVFALAASLVRCLFTRRADTRKGFGILAALTLGSVVSLAMLDVAVPTASTGLDPNLEVLTALVFGVLFAEFAGRVLRSGFTTTPLTHTS